MRPLALPRHRKRAPMRTKSGRNSSPRCRKRLLDESENLHHHRTWKPVNWLVRFYTQTVLAVQFWNKTKGVGDRTLFLLTYLTSPPGTPTKPAFVRFTASSIKPAVPLEASGPRPAACCAPGRDWRWLTRKCREADWDYGPPVLSIRCSPFAPAQRSKIHVRRPVRKALRHLSISSPGAARCRRRTSTRRCARCAARCSRPTSRSRWCAPSPTRCAHQAVGAEVVKSVTPGQMVVKIVHDELVEMLGARRRADRPQRPGAGRHHDGRPAGRRQDDHHGQDRQAPDRARRSARC